MAVLEVVDEARVRVLTLNRSDALNAFNDELYHRAGAALRKRPNASTSRACDHRRRTRVLRGPGPRRDGRLSAEGDHDFGDAGPGFPRFLDTLAALEKPVIAARQRHRGGIA